MPALFSLGQHPALETSQSQLLGGETLCAFLDDPYAICKGDRAVPIFNLIERELWTHSRIEVHLGKTQKCGTEADWEQFGCHLLKAAEQRGELTPLQWCGKATPPSLPTNEA